MKNSTMGSCYYGQATETCPQQQHSLSVPHSNQVVGNKKLHSQLHEAEDQQQQQKFFQGLDWDNEQQQQQQLQTQAFFKKKSP